MERRESERVREESVLERRESERVREESVLERREGSIPAPVRRHQDILWRNAEGRWRYKIRPKERSNDFIVFTPRVGGSSYLHTDRRLLLHILAVDPPHQFTKR